MNAAALLVAVALSGALAVPTATTSDPTAVFALVDRVVLLPSEQAPTSIEVHGAFAIAEGARGAYYRAPQVGVLRFAMGPAREATLAQWRDLAKAAGTGQVIGFGSRYELLDRNTVPTRVQAADQPAAESAPYPAGFGARLAEGIDYGPVRELKQLPRCLPVDLGGEKPPAEYPTRDVVLTCTNCLASDPGLRYVFTVATSDGDRCASSALAPGKGITSWTVPLALQIGESVTWSVHVVGGRGERTAVDVQTFVVPAKRGAERR